MPVERNIADVVNNELPLQNQNNHENKIEAVLTSDDILECVSS